MAEMDRQAHRRMCPSFLVSSSVQQCLNTQHACAWNTSRPTAPGWVVRSRCALQVPPMPPDQTRKVIERELGGVSLEDVFEWIDLEQPLGSASISQVLPLPAPGSKCCLPGREQGRCRGTRPMLSRAWKACFCNLWQGASPGQHGLMNAIFQHLHRRTVAATPKEWSADEPRYQVACHSSSSRDAVPSCSCLRRLFKWEMRPHALPDLATQQKKSFIAMSLKQYH